MSEQNHNDANSRSRSIDEICTALKTSLANAAPPRSVVETVVRLYEERRAASPTEEASLSMVLGVVAETKLTIALPGAGKGTIDRLGDAAAIDILGRLRDAGVTLMVNVQ